MQKATKQTTKNLILHYFLVLATACLFLASVFRIPETTKDSTRTPISSPKFNKLVYVVIDGLRFDGFVPTTKKGLYYNNFEFTRDPTILKTTFLSVSSIPTATTTRIIGMMTGSPSNLIEEIMTFFASKVSIESLPDKFKDRKMYFYGDELWGTCFETLAGRCKLISGYSKDNLIENEVEIIEKVLEDRENEIRFVHIISLDAFGHIYGTEHKSMQDAQVRADRFLRRLYDQIDEDTLLVVTSDHGVNNDGSHGGSSKYEMASVCGFYSKRPLELYNEAGKDFYNNKFITNFYDTSTVNAVTDWLCTTTPYKVIHQDDILPTLCYLMGVSVPANTYGNLIPFLVNDNDAEQLLLNQKRKLCRKEIRDTTVTQQNYAMTSKIYSNAVGKRPWFAILSIAFGFMTFYHMCCAINNLVAATLFFVITVWVSHSYRAFASEDLIWTASLLLANFTIPNFIFALFFLKSPGRNFFAIDRVKIHTKHFNSTSEIVFVMVLFFIFKLIGTRNRINDKALFIRNCVQALPQILFILRSNSTGATIESRIDFLCACPTLDSLFAVHMPATVALLFIYFVRNLDIKNTQQYKQMLLSFAPYLLNIEKVQQSINYRIFFALSDTFGSFSCYSGVFCYIFLPRFYLMQKFALDYTGRLLSIFSLFFCFACSWVMHGSLVFQYFFVGRLLFTVLFFAVDFTIEELMRTIIK